VPSAILLTSTKLIICSFLPLVVLQCFMMILRLTSRFIEPIAHGTISIDFWFLYAMLKSCTGTSCHRRSHSRAGVADPVAPDPEGEAGANRSSPPGDCTTGDLGTMSATDTCGPESESCTHGMEEVESASALTAVV
jgi:hypothetical protein